MLKIWQLLAQKDSRLFYRLQMRFPHLMLH
uniref:Uncharacterized protein n=1 Tax=Myoviridae sp. ctjhW4 TaxID=2825162 RepID=A0A8S5PSF9_9CAUD|nr:MAG TPA: hypothetical protein [Myoviridae sp. ctjhW4]